MLCLFFLWMTLGLWLVHFKFDPAVQKYHFLFPLKRHLVFARQVSLVRLVRSSEAARVQMWIWWLWWQSNTIHSTQHFLVAIASPSVERLCRAIATIVRSYYYQYYFAGLLLQLLCGATYTSTTIIRSFYYYDCVEILLLLLCRARGHGVPNYFSLTKDCHDRSKATEDNEQLNNVTGNNVYGKKTITPSKNVCYTQKVDEIWWNCLTWKLKSCISYFHSWWTQRCDEKNMVVSHLLQICCWSLFMKNYNAMRTFYNHQKGLCFVVGEGVLWRW